MKKLKLLLFFVFLFPFCFSNAQNNIGADLILLGDYDLAKKYFEKHTSLPAAELNYYLGEIAAAQGTPEKAKTYYTKGLEANKEYPYNEIGLGKLELKTNSKSAESTFDALIRKNWKNIDVMVAVGYAYLFNDYKTEAMDMLDKIYKIDKKNAKSYVLEADILRAEKNYGGASSKYDMALYFDSTLCIAAVKGAEIYETLNWKLSVEKLTSMITLKPDYTLSYRLLGRIYTTNGFYAKAVDAYKTFFAGGIYNLDDIFRYVTALYFNKQYDDVKKYIAEGLKIEPNHFVLNRLQMYTAANTHDVDNGLNYGKKFFTLKTEKDYLGSDYSMYASLLKDAKKYDEAIDLYYKAIAVDTNSIDLYKDIAGIINLQGKSGKAGEIYQQYTDAANDKVEVLEYLQLGRYYYSAGSVRSKEDSTDLLFLKSDVDFINKIATNETPVDSLKVNNNLFIKAATQYYLLKADAAFGKVTKLAPEGYTGYLWRARTNSLLDPESEVGLAKPYYEKIVEILAEKESPSKAISNSLIESYSYLGYFYFLKQDNENIRLYWEKVLELDPLNENAINVLKSLKK